MRSILALLIAMVTMPAIAQGPGASPPTPAPPSVPETPNSRKAREVLGKTLQVLGEPFLNIQDREETGRSYGFYRGNPAGTGLRYWRFWKWPDKERVELTKQRDVIYIHNGDAGYEVTYKGTLAEDAKDLAEYQRARRYSLEHVLRSWLSEPGVALFYEGGGITEQKPVEKVTIISAKNESVTLHIHASTFLPVKKTYTQRDPASRERDEYGDFYDNWRSVQGVMTAHTLVSFYRGEMARQRFLETVKYNAGLPDSMFTATVTYELKKKVP